MKTSRIKIRNLFGITETDLSGQSVEITGPKGSGKTSVLDAIRLALTNRSSRDLIIRQGATEGEIIIETDTGLFIDRKIRTDKADALTVKNGNMTQNSPASFLNTIFTPLQLNPVEFTKMTAPEKNRAILNLIEFQWDLKWIQDQFGEVPKGVDYEQHILQVLNDIQAEKGVYYQSRQELNREAYYKRQSIEDIAKDIPQKYQYDTWKKYDLGAKYRQLEADRQLNAEIEKASMVSAGYDSKVRSLQANAQIEAGSAEKEIAEEDSRLASEMERLKAELVAAADKRSAMAGKLASKKEVIKANYEAGLAKVQGEVQASREWMNKTPVDVAELVDEIETAETMRKYLNEYERIQKMSDEVELLKSQAETFTEKIEKARKLPGEILRTATIPICGLTVENGIPMINGLPISNLSDGELLELCVDVTIQKPGLLQIILIDGAERLDTDSRERLYAKCKEKGLQIVATRVSDSEELEVSVL